MAKAFINSLSSDAVDYLAASENMVVPAQSQRTSILMILGGITLASFAGFLTYDYRWSQLKLAFVGLLIFIASYCLIYGIWVSISSRSRKLSPGLIVTRDHAVFVENDYIEWFSVADLINADYRHQFNGRSYEFSTLTVTFVNAVRKYRVDGMELVESTVDDIEERKRLSLVRANRSEDVPDGPLESTLRTNGRVRLRSLVPIALLALAVGILAAFGTLQLNEYFHEGLSWQAAVEANTAGSYRHYLKANPAGRRRDEATRRLKALYDNAEARYRASLSPGYDQAAVDTILALIRYARETHEYQVQVSFERSADIPEDLVERLKREFEVKTVLPLGNTFTPERMLEREGQLFAVVNSSFKQIFPDDILELVLECTGSCAELKIRYGTSFMDSIYYDLREKDIPEIDRNWSPGILIEWNCSLTVPSEAQSYSFGLESAPAQHITYDTDGGDSDSEADQQSFYDAMVTSSFADFRAHLLFNLGLGQDPHPEPAPGSESPESMH